MVTQVALLESQYARLATMQPSFDDSTKVAVLKTALQEGPRYKSLKTSISVKIEKDTTWWHISILFLGEANRLNNRRKADVFHTLEESGSLAQASGKFNRNSKRKKATHLEK